ncbi:MAG: TIGR03557 family F420-dependent LLM class oxidoreductase [Halanaeroarchaeum sp.]
MVRIDYMAHQEQYSPSRLLDYSAHAEEAGFEMVWTSDHFHPWFHTDAEAGFAWSWLGAAARELGVPVGTCVTPGTGHYHPGVLAQATATIQEMTDETVALGLGTGEAMNARPLGHDWPEYEVRRDQLEETIEMVQELWDAEGFVTHDGEHFDLDEAHLYTDPGREPELHVAASGPSTARLAAKYADGLVTVLKGEEFTERFYPAVRRYAEEEGRDPDEIETTLLVIPSYHPDYETAIEGTKPWWATTQDVFSRDVSNPKEIEEIGAEATREDVEAKFLVADDPSTIAAKLENWAEMGFDRIALANTSPDPELFFDVMADEVLPSL